MEEQVILVDENDAFLRTAGKMEAHINGWLHRAFSVFIFNQKGELLLQQRADHKYHSPGKWTNTCCSHPRPTESTLEAAQRRLAEEMGMECELEYGFNFVYRASFDNGLIEHEFDHVFFGWSDSVPLLNPEEVKDYTYVTLDVLSDELAKSPQRYSAWLNICFDKLKAHFDQNYSNKFKN